MSNFDKMTDNFVTITSKAKNTNLNYKLINAGGNFIGCLQVIINIKKHHWDWFDNKSNWNNFITEISNLINRRRVNIYKNLPNIRNSMHTISIILGDVNMKVNTSVYNTAFNDRINIIEKIYEIINNINSEKDNNKLTNNQKQLQNNIVNQKKSEITIKSKFDILCSDSEEDNDISYSSSSKEIINNSSNSESWADRMKTGIVGKHPILNQMQCKVSHMKPTNFNKSEQLIKKEYDNLKINISNTYNKLLENNITKIFIK
jgi:hypothetical protein